MYKKDGSYKTIGEVAKILKLENKNNGTLSTHTIRFWEKEFKQIKPLILKGNRRYFDPDTIKLLKKIKFLLKDQGLTINGVKKFLKNKNPLELDEIINESIKTSNIKNKILKLSNIIKDIKKIK